MPKRILILLLCGIAYAADPHPSGRTTRWEVAGIVIDIAHPGGNAIVEGGAGDEIRVRPDRRDGDRWWFHWSFQVEGAGGRSLTFRFLDGKPVGVRGPALSTDGGRTWRWQDDVAGKARDRFTHAFPAGQGPVRFAMGIPHQQADWESAVAPFKDRPGFAVGEFCRSRHGRLVERIRAGRLEGAPWCLLITARHHACEAMAGFALEGMVAAIMDQAGDGPWWREQVEVMAIPFVDKDGVEEGDQGKGRKPHDHGRDYIDNPLYPETAAIMAQVPAWTAGRPFIAVDLHCPFIDGATDRHIYQVGAQDAVAWREQQRLGRLLESCRQGALPYVTSGDVAFGTAWNTAANYAVGATMLRGMRGWAATVPGCRLATTCEIPYADVQGMATSPENVRAFGRDLAQALRRYIEATR